MLNIKHSSLLPVTPRNKTYARIVRCVRRHHPTRVISFCFAPDLSSCSDFFSQHIQLLKIFKAQIRRNVSHPAMATRATAVARGSAVAEAQLSGARQRGARKASAWCRRCGDGLGNAWEIDPGNLIFKPWRLSSSSLNDIEWLEISDPQPPTQLHTQIARVGLMCS